MSELTNHLKTHIKLGTPITDENGNILAHVAPRLDTLANLLLVSDAGDGEVATVSDESALVVYRGSPSVPEVYVRPVETGYFRTTSSFNSTTLAPATDNQAVITNAGLDPNSLVDVVNNTFIRQLLESTISATKKLAGIDVYVAMLAISTPADLSQLTFKLEKFSLGVWVSMYAFGETTIDVATSAGSSTLRNVTIKIPGESIITNNDLRLIVTHDSASSFAASFEIEGILTNRFGGEFVVV